MKKAWIIFLILFIWGVPLFCQEIDDEDEEDEIVSLRVEQIETLKYGIDSEVIELLSALNSEENDEFNDEVLNQIKITTSRDMISAGFQLFITTEYREAEDFAIYILNNEDLYNNNVLNKAMLYLGKDLDDKGAEAIAALLGHEEASVARSAVAALGKIKNEEYAVKLLELLEDDDFHDEVKTTILVSLGDMEAISALEVLTDIATDPDEEKAWRWYACESLGKIGADESFGVLQSLLSDDDPNLRSFAVEGIGYFENSDTPAILISALRDSFWKVRISAAKRLGELGAVEAVDILKYKASNDPELNVKKEAVIALGKIGSTESFEYLNELAASKRTNPAIWACSVDALVENNLQESMLVFTKMIEEEWETENSYHLQYLAKAISIKEGGFLQSITGKFLEHSSINVKIYGLRMSEKNGFNSLRERIEELSSEDNPNPIRKAALSAIESF